MKIGIFGGSFNPVHKGHTRLANHIAASGVVDMVYMMPCYKSLYNKGVLSGEHRLEMIELAERHPNVYPYNWEIKNKIEGMGTYDIMKLLEKGFPNDELYFIIGLDNSQKVRSWLNGDKIVNELKFIVVPRNGVNTTDIWFMDPPHIWLGSYEGDDISSTGVKELLKSGGDLENHLDPKVKDYIIHNELYKE
jgi:nicotinate-nucleotide adenylyltransferase